MFAKDNRARSQDINSVLRSKNRFFNEYFKIFTLPFIRLRCSVVISKKVLKRRVDRNKQKRRILHIIKEMISLENKSYCILWVQKDTSHLNHQELKQQLHAILKQSRLI